jgi:elongator complex protein 3
MATMTMTAPLNKKTAKKNNKLIPENERYMRACSDIANALIQEYESQRDSSAPRKDVNLNKLRGMISKKHSLATQPPLTAIIAAVPENYKKYILPKLIAKPIRKSDTFEAGKTFKLIPPHRNLLWYRRCRCDVQASPMPSYRVYR